jgi:rhodanese-related sulfurtransferase
VHPKDSEGGMKLVLVQRSLAIVGLGCIIGASDSWLRPTVITLKENTPAPVRGAASGETQASQSEMGRPASAHQSSGETRTSESVKDEATEPKQTDSTTAPLGLMIDSKAAKALFDQGVVFLDARIQSEYDEGHIPQAFLLNSSMFGTSAADEAMKVMDANQPVVIYCGGGDCDASKNVAILLQQAGFKQLHIIEHGFPEWKQLGYPIETGADKAGTKK